MQDSRYIVAQEVEKGLMCVYGTAITVKQVQATMKMLDFPKNLNVDLALFSSISCVANRLFKLDCR